MRAVERPAITAEMNRHITGVSLLKIKTVPLMKRICTCDVHFQPCVQDMCSVGTSNSGSKQIQKMIQDMPNWLRPTAGFGIGLQSIFLLTDQFEVDTSTGTETFHAVVHSKRTGGYLQLQRAEKSLPRGTTIRIQFKMPENFQFSFGGETDQYLEFHLDPISPEDYTGEVRVLESIRINCQDSKQ